MNRGSTSARETQSAPPLGPPVLFQGRNQAVPGQASHQCVGRDHALDAYRIPVPRERDLVSRLQAHGGEKGLRDDDLTFTANPLSHSTEYRVGQRPSAIRS